MKYPLYFFLTGLCLLFIPAQAEAGRFVPYEEYADERLEVPEGAEVTLALTQKEYLIGDPVGLDFCLKNTSETPFKFNHGGDYRGSGRHDRFQITAQDEQGNFLPDPNENRMMLSMGGLGGTYELEPGEEWCETLPLLRYRVFDRDGIYTVTAKHDFGWHNEPLPEGKITVTMKMPTKKQARALVEEMYTLEDRSNYVSFSEVSGKRTTEKKYADFTTINHPIYLPIILEYAKKNDPKAITTLENMHFPEATKALINLIDTDDEVAVSNLMWRLEQRLPDHKTKVPYDPNSEWEIKRQKYFQMVWRDEFAADLRKHIPRFLNSGNFELVKAGGRIVFHLGEPEDMKVLIAALDKAIAGSADYSVPSEWNYPRDPQPANTLYLALPMMLNMGVEVSKEPKSLGEIAAYILSIHLRDDLTTEEWAPKIKSCMTHEIPYIRKLALTVLRKELPDSLDKDLLEAVRDNHHDVAIEACWAIHDRGVEGAKDGILAKLKSTPDRWYMSCAVNVAHKFRWRSEILPILVDQLQKKEDYCDVINHIKTFVIGMTNSGWGCNSNDVDLDALQARWKAFLEEYQEKLATEENFDFSDQAITPDLFPDMTYYVDGDRIAWPIEKPIPIEVEKVYYDGFERDRGFLRDTYLVTEDPELYASTDKAITAAYRIFHNVSFLGMTKDEVMEILGDPATISGYGIAMKPGKDSSMMYVFDMGYGGWTFKLHFQHGEVYKVERVPLE